MPIYEFYCPACHTIYSFFSLRVNTEARPACPVCARPELERQASVFSRPRGLPEPITGGLPDFDETRLDRIYELVQRHVPPGSEENPQLMAQAMTAVYREMGVPLPVAVEEAMRRLESGEDPERIEEELGPVFDNVDVNPVTGVRVRREAPRRDETLYDL